MEIKFRTMTPEDYNDLINLWKKAKLSYKPEGRDSETNIINQLQLPTNRFILAETDGKIVGSIIASHNRRKGWINRLAVDPEYRRKGLAKKLISEAEKFLKEEGIGIFAALVEGWNDASKKLFESVGYNDFKGIVYFTKRLKKGI